MIDNYTQAMELMEKMKAHLPISAQTTKSFVQAMRGRNVNISSNQDLQIEHVFYMGDEGGIGCGLRFPQIQETALVVSLTHLRIKNNHPLAEEIQAYQRERTKRLATTGNMSKPRSFTFKPRKKR